MDKMGIPFEIRVRKAEWSIFQCISIKVELNRKNYLNVDIPMPYQIYTKALCFSYMNLTWKTCTGVNFEDDAGFMLSSTVECVYGLSRFGFSEIEAWRKSQICLQSSEINALVPFNKKKNTIQSCLCLH